MSYQPKFYRQQGGDRAVVASGGSLDVESGGEIDIESGGALKLAGTSMTQTAAVLNRAGAAFPAPQALTGLSTKSTGSVSMAQTGVSILSSSGTTGGAALFKLPAPTAAILGATKTIFCNNVSTGKLARVESTGATVTFGTTLSTGHGLYHRLDFNAPEDCVVLTALTATKWGITSNVGSVSATTPLST